MLYSTVVIDICTGRVLVRFPDNYAGSVAYCKGASPAETAAANAQTQLTQQMSQNYAALFSGQQNILKSLTSAFTPTLNAGANQYGFNQAEDTALRTAAGEKTAQTFAQSERALQNNLAARGGGNTLLPSGAEGQLEAENYNQAAAQESNQNLGITEAGYNVGRQNYTQAAGALTSAAGLENPTAAGGVLSQTAQNAFGAQTKVSEDNNAGSFGAIAGGLLGGAADAFLGGVGKTVGFSGGGGGSSTTPAYSGGSTFDEET